MARGAGHCPGKWRLLPQFERSRGGASILERAVGGVHRYLSLTADIGEFANHSGGDFEFVRLAVTPEQAQQYRVQSAPPKATDRRRFQGANTYQAEALDPQDLAKIVRAAIETTPARRGRHPGRAPTATITADFVAADCQWQPARLRHGPASIRTEDQ
jgi:hypothetical protein